MKDGEAEPTAYITIEDGEAQAKHECPLNSNAIFVCQLILRESAKEGVCEERLELEIEIF